MTTWFCQIGSNSFLWVPRSILSSGSLGESFLPSPHPAQSAGPEQPLFQVPGLPESGCGLAAAKSITATYGYTSDCPRGHAVEAFASLTTTKLYEFDMAVQFYSAYGRNELHHRELAGEE